MPRKVRLSKRPAVPSLLVAMRWAFKHPANEDRTQEQRVARRMMDEHLKEFMARMASMEAAMKAAYVPNASKAAAKSLASSSGQGSISTAQGQGESPSSLPTDGPWERTKELILSIIEEAKR